jgi:hypothetical protein
MHHWLGRLALPLLLTLGGCDHITGAAISSLVDLVKHRIGQDSVSQAIARMGGFADAMCRCRDKACAARVSDEMVEFGKAMSERYAGQPEPPVSDAQKLTMESHTARLMRCTTTAVEK